MVEMFKIKLLISELNDKDMINKNLISNKV